MSNVMRMNPLEWLIREIDPEASLSHNLNHPSHPWAVVHRLANGQQVVSRGKTAHGAYEHWIAFRAGEPWRKVYPLDQERYYPFSFLAPNVGQGRNQANALGLRFYRGRKCKYGHRGLRITKTGKCFDCEQRK
jgi:hypothetical protein